MHRRWIRIVGAVLALTLLSAACGGDEGDGDGANGGDGASPTAGGGGGADLTVVNFSFSPANLTVSDGDTITVANISDTSHTFTTDDEAIDVSLGAGEEVEVPIEGVSSQGFHCEIHPQMKGRLTVQ